MDRRRTLQISISGVPFQASNDPLQWLRRISLSLQSYFHDLPVHAPRFDVSGRYNICTCLAIRRNLERCSYGSICFSRSYSTANGYNNAESHAHYGQSCWYLIPLSGGAASQQLEVQTNQRQQKHKNRRVTLKTTAALTNSSTSASKKNTLHKW